VGLQLVEAQFPGPDPFGELLRCSHTPSVGPPAVEGFPPVVSTPSPFAPEPGRNPNGT
jgi:hypothetical protein